MENYNEQNTVNRTQDLHEDDFTEREPTNEERWVNDVNKEFDEDVPLVNEVDPDDDIPFEDEDDEFDGIPPLDDDEIGEEIPVEEPEEGIDDDDLFPQDDDELEADEDDVEFK